MKLGIYGGSFDPVHLGHLLVAQAAVEELGLDKLFFIPAAQSPFKPDAKPAPDAVRLQLLRLALAGKSNCEIDDQEIRRGGTSYTIDTLRDYAKRFPGAELFYLIGADNAAKLNEWREANELAALAEFVVVPRPGVEGVSLWRFLVPNPRANEKKFAGGKSGSASRGRGHPRGEALRLKFIHVHLRPFVVKSPVSLWILKNWRCCAANLRTIKRRKTLWCSMCASCRA